MFNLIRKIWTRDPDADLMVRRTATALERARIAQEGVDALRATLALLQEREAAREAVAAAQCHQLEDLLNKLRMERVREHKGNGSALGDSDLDAITRLRGARR